MKNQIETYTIDTSEPGFIGIRQVKVKEDGTDLSDHLWFERDSLSWVVDTLRAAISNYGFPRTETTIGKDSLRVFESGHEQAPYINLFNLRPADAPHGERFALAFSKQLVDKLVDQLAGIA
ncbi:MAG TPA: hypothetical protein VK698_32670 [Kofleriaceae bacterium]|nr:hypothetical protein [Kofleriaceae bacterium]